MLLSKYILLICGKEILQEKKLFLKSRNIQKLRHLVPKLSLA